MEEVSSEVRVCSLASGRSRIAFTGRQGNVRAGTSWRERERGGGCGGWRLWQLPVASVRRMKREVERMPGGWGRDAGGFEHLHVRGRTRASGQEEGDGIPRKGCGGIRRGGDRCGGVAGDSASLPGVESVEGASAGYTTRRELYFPRC